VSPSRKERKKKEPKKTEDPKIKKNKNTIITVRKVISRPITILKKIALQS
jgi:hypothetical protein